MKNILKSVFILFAALVASCSVDDVQDRPVIEGVDSPILSAPESGSTYTLSPANMTQQAERFVWSKANYNGDVAISYTLEIDVEGGDFSAPQNLGGTTGALQLSVSQETLNGACLALGANPYSATNFDVRVVSSASGFDLMGSNKVTITVIPFTTDLPQLAVPGNHQGWSPGTAPRIAASGFGQTDYEGYVWLDGEFKFVGPNGSGVYDWGNTDWGDNGDFSGILAETGESNCSAVTGYYRVRANTGTLTYTTTAVSWGIIGAATPTGWDSDTDLTYNSTTKKLEIASIALVPGAFKFRGNNAWSNGFDLGTVNADGFLVDGGDLTFSGPAGNYKVILDLSNPRKYTYELIAL
ncbi:SusE domain-containing protein [Flavobacterium lacisediminis]|uniref:SusE domain-containing protein n=1 Tax=Flavobacterium lacisediminis TaxID=2989705 RepID=A0ABT3EI15_9FLAO|nr:SusE domain-containing protein [Flavobacterium lacisediminis]MCW1148051.1 SusE domain-containing protein [Flavobacterium lacisediminis]